MKWKRLLLWVVLALGLERAAAQGPNVDELSKEANAAYEVKDWEKTAKLYAELSKQIAEPPPRVWLRLGAALRGLGKYDEALAAFEKANQSGAGLFGEYGKASVYAALKQPEKAFASLDSAVKQGYADPDNLLSDANLADLKSDPRFAKIVKQARKNQRPCAYEVKNREFDFWLGEWEVSTTQGNMAAGNSRIELILEDCVVQENWESLNSMYAGKSYNIYNAALKRWEQYWVDNVGGNIFFYGGLKDGAMDYWTDELPQPDGTKLRRHLQFIKLGPDTVRQFSRGSSDGGKTWKVEYDLTYRRKSKG